VIWDRNQRLRSHHETGVKKLIVIGGAGSLEVSPGAQLVDAPAFPQAYRFEALAAHDFLSELRREQQLDWTLLSLSAEFVPGESGISFEDFAIALVVRTQ
jgi:putative NADH-flavin reductase